MGLISNMCIFTLMVFPLLLLVKGHHVEFRRLTALAALITTCLIAESTLLSSLAGTPLLLQYLATAVVVPMLDTALMHFVLNDPKARKHLHIHDAGDDAAVVVATLWAAIDLLLYRWFRWYHVISGLGFDAENLISAAEAFVSLITLLLAARRLNGRGSYVSNTTTTTTNNNNSDGAWMTVTAVRVGAAVVSVVTEVPLLGHILCSIALAVVQFLFFPTLEVGRKED